jgi:hypothetical protein
MRPLKSKLTVSVASARVFASILVFAWTATIVDARGQSAVKPTDLSQLPLKPPAIKASQSGGDGSKNLPVKSSPSAGVSTPVSTESLLPLAPPPYLSSLESTNVFDQQRKLWPDKRPPPPPPPPPVPPPAITEKDLQLYGVVIVGDTKRATIKVGPRFAQLDTQGRGFVSVSEGQAIGEWTLMEIQPAHLVLGAPGGRQTVMFNKKSDRVASASAQPSQPTPVVATESVSSAISGSTAQQNEAAAVRLTGGSTPGGSGSSAAAISSAVAENAIKNAPPGSLAAAIGAAQAAAQSTSNQSQTVPPANFNPFLQLFPKQ